MSAPVQKLKTLLERVQQRRQTPRLKDVSAQPATEAFDAPARASLVPLPSPERPSLAPALDRSSRPPSVSTPLEDAMADLQPESGVRASEPVTPTLSEMPSLSVRPTQPPPEELSLDELEAPLPALSPSPQLSLAADAAKLVGPAGRDEAPPAPFSAPAPTSDPFAVLPSFSLPATDLSQPPPAPMPLTVPAAPAPRAAAPASLPAAPPPGRPEPAEARSPEEPLMAPSARIEPTLPPATQPVARAVSPARVEAPKTFGELVGLTLSLRPIE